MSRKWQPGVTWFTLRMENIADTTLALTLSQGLVKQIRSEREREREREGMREVNYIHYPVVAEKEVRRQELVLIFSHSA